jgi:hypothetical protein
MDFRWSETTRPWQHCAEMLGVAAKRGRQRSDRRTVSEFKDCQECDSLMAKKDCTNPAD